MLNYKETILKKINVSLIIHYCNVKYAVNYLLKTQTE